MMFELFLYACTFAVVWLVLEMVLLVFGPEVQKGLGYVGIGLFALSWIQNLNNEIKNK